MKLLSVLSFDDPTKQNDMIFELQFFSDVFKDMVNIKIVLTFENLSFFHLFKSGAHCLFLISYNYSRNSINCFKEGCKDLRIYFFRLIETDNQAKGNNVP